MTYSYDVRVRAGERIEGFYVDETGYYRVTSSLGRIVSIIYIGD